MPLSKIPFDELRNFCWKRLQTLEIWLRNLIHLQLSNFFNKDYFQNAMLSGNYIFSSEIRRHVQTRIEKEPSRFRLPIDALLLEQEISIICKTDVFKKFFKEPLSLCFPNGPEEAKTILSRLIPIRNSLAHSNNITIHEAERVFCYSDDVIFSLSEYYKKMNLNQEYNTPRFVRFTDSVGNNFVINSTEEELDFSKEILLRPGQTIRFEVDVDTVFPQTDYLIKWYVGYQAVPETGEGHSFELTLLPKHVSTRFCLSATLISKNEWHRHSNYDSQVTIYYKVLPPL